ncbi:cuticle protein 16.8 [Caerostris extrusa]|uniref:Cuticle protein 16.8 n=1 Tax=Caerostris extrusa TaxID=172846 RepID=A0AAV4Y9X4_CAEEX|nr:cuticle protein 16.8 [Caerostris extrusa]
MALDGFTDDRDIARQVNYVADHSGFRAQVKTNELGTANQSPCRCPHDLQRSLPRGSSSTYNSRPNEPLELSDDTVLGLLGAYSNGVNGYGYGSGRNGLGYGGYGSGMYVLAYGGYGSSMNGLGRPNETLELSADTVLGLIGGYGYGVNGYGYGSGRNGLGYGGYGNIGYGRSLGYNGGVVNFGAPLIGGGIRGYDSIFVNVA